jgi:hypothetical protein
VSKGLFTKLLEWRLYFGIYSIIADSIFFILMPDLLEPVALAQLLARTPASLPIIGSVKLIVLPFLGISFLLISDR